MLTMNMPFYDDTRYIEFTYFSAECYVDESGYLGSLYSGERGKGHASSLLRGICDYMDRAGRTMTLVAYPYTRKEGEQGLSWGEVVKFYHRHGFKVTSCRKEGGYVYMKRNPVLRLGYMQ